MTSDKDIDPLDLPICTTCGTQFSTPTPPTPCPICDDPRQYLPPSGQDYTTAPGAAATGAEINEDDPL
ncbi:hypothetical protein CBS133816_9504 [Aspergillus niger]|nr:hypothetical protein CBS133816_9504 [Aspergillus niger]